MIIAEAGGHCKNTEGMCKGMETLCMKQEMMRRDTDEVYIVVEAMCEMTDELCCIAELS